MTLKTQVEGYLAQKAAYDLLIKSQTMKVQKAEAETALITITAKIKTDVSNDDLKKEDFKLYLSLDSRIQSITTQTASVKAQLTILKGKLEDPAHQQEVQEEINSLVI